jgi:hypothetical protein
MEELTMNPRRLKDLMNYFILRWIVVAFAFVSATNWAHAQPANPPLYSEIIPTSSGLTYDPARDARETFVAPNGKTVEVLVKGPAGSGTYSRTIRPGEAADTYFPAVVQEAIAAGAHHLVIPKGVYTFAGPHLCTNLKSPACTASTACNVYQYWNCQPHWTIGQYPQGEVATPNSVTDLDIDFRGSELNFSAPATGIWILEAQRLRLRNLTIDWPKLPIASLGTIVADPGNPGHNALVIDAKYPVMDAWVDGPVQIQAVDLWDDNPSPGRWDPTAGTSFETYFIFSHAPQPTYVGKTSAGAQTFSCKSCNFQNSATDPSCSFFSGCANFDNFTLGSRVIVRHYITSGFAFLVNWSNDIDVENLTLLSGPGPAIIVTNNGGYRGFRLAHSAITRAPGRLISMGGGGIAVAQQADVIIQDNDIGYQGDDAVGLNQTISSISGVSGATISVPGVCDPDPMDSPITGDRLAFFDVNFIYANSAQVMASSGSNCGTLTLTLDHAIAGLDTTYSLVDLTQQPTARYVIRDNVFHDCRCHGVLTNGPYGLIDHNMMLDNSQGGLAIFGGNGQGPGGTNILLTRNVVQRPGQWAQWYGALSMVAPDANGVPLAATLFDKIRIAENFILDAPGPAIVATSARDFVFGPNTILSSNQVQASPFSFGTLSTLDSILVDQSASGAVCGIIKAGGTTGPVGIDPTSQGVTVSDKCAGPVGPAKVEPGE